MALPSSGAMSFSAIRAEYGKSGAFSMSQCAGLNGQLPSGSTAQISASDFRSARRGPDSITLTRAAFNFGGNFSGYIYNAQGSVSSRTVNETANSLVHIFAGGGGTAFKRNNHAGHWRVYVNGSNKGTGTWNSGSSQYDYPTQWWGPTTTGNVTIQYRYNN